VDWATGVADYEFYRAAAWQCSQVRGEEEEEEEDHLRSPCTQALAHLAESTTFTRDASHLATRLRWGGSKGGGTKKWNGKLREK